MAFVSTNPILDTLNLTLQQANPSTAITEIRFDCSQGEFECDTTAVLIENTANEATQVYLNVNTQQYTTENTDFSIALQQLQATFPNVTKIHIAVAWYVTDLACGNTLVRPGVVNSTLATAPYNWEVAGLTRSQAYVVSNVNGIPVYRGTPNDQSLINAIFAFSAAGYQISMSLDLLCDIPINNILANPYSDNALVIGEPTYPSSSLITVTPAQGYVGTPWGSIQADYQVDAFFGTEDTASYTCTFSANGALTTVVNGSISYSYSNYVLYYATLLSSMLNTFAGINLSDFHIGYGLSGLTSVQGASGGYSAVTNLSNLINQVKTLFQNFDTKLSYVANWDEWQGTENLNSAGTSYTFPASRIFNMDPLWSNPNVDYIAVAPNFPITDWRNTGKNNDGLYYPASNNQPYIVEGLLGQQYYDYFYASDSDRTNQTRTPIVGPTLDTTWIYQLKNFDSWIENYHYNYDSQSFSASATNWVPKSKNIYFLGLSMPSVNLGTNEPDAYINNASTLYSLPYFSNGLQDTNIISTFFGIYATYLPYITNYLESWSVAIWDARPYPWYPTLNYIWYDWNNYNLDSTLNDKIVNIDTTTQYNQYVNYNLLMTETFAGNPYWLTLNQSMDQQWNNLVNSPVNELQNIRNVNSIEDELKAANVRQMGYVIPDYGLQYYQYNSLMQYLGAFYLTRGVSNQFVNFVSFFSRIKFNYIPLFANGLNYNTLTSQPGGTLITVAASGTWIPTPYYDVSYDPSTYPDLNENLYRQLLVQSAPIYLVLRSFVGEVFFPSVYIYFSSQLAIDKNVSTIPNIPVIDPVGLRLLTINVPIAIDTGVPFSVSGTTLGSTDQITVSIYNTNNTTLILAGRVSPITTISTSSSGGNYNVELSSTEITNIWAVVFDETQITNNGVVSRNEIALSNEIGINYIPIITQQGPSFYIATEYGAAIALESSTADTLSLTGYPNSGSVGVPLTITGTTFAAGNAVTIALSTSNSIQPTTGFTNATMSGTNWTASITPNSSGNYYVWAQLISDANLFVVSKNSIEII